MARCIAKYIVGNHLADECEVQLGYVIGKSNPVSVNLNTFGTGKIDDQKLTLHVTSKFDLSVERIIDFLQLRKPIFQSLSNYGHFGRDRYVWERYIAATTKSRK